MYNESQFEAEVQRQKRDECYKAKSFGIIGKSLKKIKKKAGKLYGALSGYSIDNWLMGSLLDPIA